MVVLADLRENGWTLAHGLSVEGAQAAVEAVGRILLETRVVEGGRGDAGKTIPLHTDHWRAEVVAWYCHARAEQGGETLLADAREALASLKRADRIALSAIGVRCDGMLAADTRTAPLVRMLESGQPSVYYAPGLVSDEQRRHPCLVRFKAAVGALEAHRIPLARGDLLVVDNGRMLHGRAPLGSRSSRELTRWWITSAPA